MADMTTSELDIYRTANLLIQQHGGDAPIFAAMKADEMLDSGDMDGCLVWKRVLKAIDEIMAQKVPEGTTIQ